jgi:hypothetical protein
MANKRIKVIVPIVYDDDVTDPESLAIALDRLLETATSTPRILEDYGNPTIEETELAANEPEDA